MIGQIVKADCGCIMRINDESHYDNEPMYFCTCIKMSKNCTDRGLSRTQRLKLEHFVEMTKEEKLEYL